MKWLAVLLAVLAAGCAAPLAIGNELGLGASEIHRDLARENGRDFESTALYRAVFGKADALAERVAARQARCLQSGASRSSRM
jgi:hypothetical protein